ncbi:MAG TPA: aminotransferase class IV [Vicinamibacteria bacterium]
MTARTLEILGERALARADMPTLGAASAELPEGSYTTLRTYGGRGVARLERHLRRLEDSAGAPPGTLDRGAVRRALGRVLDDAGHPESRLRITFAPPRLFVTVEPFVALPAGLYAAGAWCVTLHLRRDNPRAKDTRFLASADEARARLPPGAHEGVLVGGDGALLEGLSSNFFAVRGGRLYTEEERVLHGVTRDLVLEVAASVLPRAGRAARLEEAGAIEEAFLTSVSRGILPVARLDDVVLGAAPGPVTSALTEGFEERVRREVERL